MFRLLLTFVMPHVVLNMTAFCVDGSSSPRVTAVLMPAPPPLSPSDRAESVPVGAVKLG